MSEVTGAARKLIADKFEGTLKGDHLSLKNLSLAHGYIEATIEGNNMKGTYLGGSQRINELTATRAQK